MKQNTFATKEESLAFLKQWNNQPVWGYYRHEENLRNIENNLSSIESKKDLVLIISHLYNIDSRFDYFLEILLRFFTQKDMVGQFFHNIGYDHCIVAQNSRFMKLLHEPEHEERQDILHFLIQNMKGNMPEKKFMCFILSIYCTLRMDNYDRKTVIETIGFRPSCCLSDLIAFENKVGPEVDVCQYLAEIYRHVPQEMTDFQKKYGIGCIAANVIYCKVHNMDLFTLEELDSPQELLAVQCYYQAYLEGQAIDNSEAARLKNLLEEAQEKNRMLEAQVAALQ